MRLRLIVDFDNFVDWFNKFYFDIEIAIYQILFDNHYSLVNRNRQNENLINLRIDWLFDFSRKIDFCHVVSIYERQFMWYYHDICETNLIIYFFCFSITSKSCWSLCSS